MEENIQSTLQEDRLFVPSAEFSSKARIKNRAELDALRAKAEADHEGFWAELARNELDWQTPFTSVLDESNAPHYQWFNDGKLNVSYNCLDRHLAERGDKTAIVFEGEKGDTRHISYSELHRDVCQFANGLKSLGVGVGDRVILYMPMTPEA
ncbi:Acetyl-CoA synthetase, partial [hydrothermal vent metagenome]